MLSHFIRLDKKATATLSVQKYERTHKKVSDAA